MVQRKHTVKKIIAIATLALAPTLSFAGGHASLVGHGTARIIDSHVMEGKSGVLVRNISSDVWIWDNPPEGFDAATGAECTQYIAFAKGQEAPVGGTVTCRSIDGTGDVLINTGTFQPNNSVLLSTIAATGKWAAFVGAQWVGTTRHPIEGGSVYDFKPVN